MRNDCLMDPYRLEQEAGHAARRSASSVRSWLSKGPRCPVDAAILARCSLPLPLVRDMLRGTPWLKLLRFVIDFLGASSPLS